MVGNPVTAAPPATAAALRNCLRFIFLGLFLIFPSFLSLEHLQAAPGVNELARQPASLLGGQKDDHAFLNQEPNLRAARISRLTRRFAIRALPRAEPVFS
jgi:hypothetical protein